MLRAFIAGVAGAAVMAGCTPAATGQGKLTAIVEVSPLPNPDPTCIQPMRLRNENPVDVNVRHRLSYSGNGFPGCNASWTKDDNTFLTKKGDGGETASLGCSQIVSAGSTCVITQRWTILSVTAAK